MVNMRSKYVWYACYGSNLNKKRFLLYILGGPLEGTGRIHPGCSNKELPNRESTITIPFELYFSKKSKFWENMAISFVKSKRDKSARTLCRLYLVSEEQFIEIMMQENDKNPSYMKPEIDFQLTMKTGVSTIGNKDDFLWYGKHLYIGEKEAFPIFSFTAKWADDTIECEKPGKKYLKTIINGIKESFDLSHDEIFSYLKNKCGIKSEISEVELYELIKS